MIIVDTGPLVAAANRVDKMHSQCIQLFHQARSIRRPLIVPQPIISEVCYMLSSRVGALQHAAFLTSFSTRQFQLGPVLSQDLERAAELVVTYSDLPLDGADACVVALAERLKITDIATVDRKDFSVIRPRHIRAFNLLPDF